MLAAVPHRHPHRGPFAPGGLPAGLLAGLQHDARAEGAMLALIDRTIDYQQLADIIGAAGRVQDLDPLARPDMRRWSRGASSRPRDGIPAPAFASRPGRGATPARLPQRDFDLCRGLRQLADRRPPPPP